MVLLPQMKKIFITIIVIAMMIASYIAGYYKAIYSADLIYTTEIEYEIDFNGHAHKYQY